ncbi:MAG: hypothetical protein WBR26_21275 [Candidatus Acidiferrum sp.]
MEKNEQIFFAAAILLAASVGQTHEAADAKQIGIAVDNAHRLYEAVEKRRTEVNARPNS